MKPIEKSILGGLLLGITAMFAIAATPIKDLILQSNLDAAGYSITNLAEPTNSTSAATLGTVTNSIALAATNYATAAQGALADSALQRPPTPLWLCANFFNSTEKLNLAVTTDGVHMRSLGPANLYTDPTANNVLRDPSLIRYNNKWYIAYTPGGFSQFRGYFTILESDDLVTWTELTDVQVQADDSNYTWAPDFFVDSNNDVYVFYGIGSQKFVKCTDGTLTNWSSPADVTHTGAPGGYLGGLDATCFRVGSNYYIVNFGSYGAATNGLALLKSTTSPAGPYSMVSTDLAAATTLGPTPEAPTVVRLPDGRWRLYTFVAGSSAEGRYKVCESDGTDIETTTWGDWLSVDSPSDPTGGGNGWTHGSCIQITESDEYSDVLQAMLVGVDGAATDRAQSLIYDERALTWDRFERGSAGAVAKAALGLSTPQAFLWHGPAQTAQLGSQFVTGSGSATAASEVLTLSTGATSNSTASRTYFSYRGHYKGYSVPLNKPIGFRANVSPYSAFPGDSEAWVTLGDVRSTNAGVGFKFNTNYQIIPVACDGTNIVEGPAMGSFAAFFRGNVIAYSEGNGTWGVSVDGNGNATNYTSPTGGPSIPTDALLRAYISNGSTTNNNTLDIYLIEVFSKP